MKKILYFCGAVVMLFLASCDKDAEKEKIVTTSGTYSDSIFAGLYIPDAEIEAENLLWSNGNQTAVACDTIVNGKVDLFFTNDDKTTISMNDLKGLTFRIPYVYYEYNPNDPDENYFYMRDIYEGGSFSKVINIVANHKSPAEINDEEFYKFIAKANYLEDTISFVNIKTCPLVMKETGAVYTTFDYEQNSFYERVKLEPFTYQRKTNLFTIVEYVEKNFMGYLTQDEQEVIKDIKAKIGQCMQGTITDASGWCMMGYANYRPHINLTIEKATGIIDVLSDVLYGPYKRIRDKNYDYVVAKDKNGNPVPAQTLWLEVEFDGKTLLSFKKEEDK